MPKHGPKGNPHGDKTIRGSLPPWLQTILDAAEQGGSQAVQGAEGLFGLGKLGGIGLLDAASRSGPVTGLQDIFRSGPQASDAAARNALYNLLIRTGAGSGNFPQPGDLLQGAGGAIQGLFPPGQQSANPVQPLPANPRVDTFADDDTIFFGPGVGRNEREGKLKDIKRDMKIDDDIQSLREKLQKPRTIGRKTTPRGSSSRRPDPQGQRAGRLGGR